MEVTSEICNVSSFEDVQEAGSYLAVGYAAMVAYSVEVLYLILVYKETLVKPDELQSLATVIRESFYVPLVTVFSTRNFVYLEICHFCNKFSTIGALPL